MKLQRVLNLRMYGDDVQFLQTKLKELGFFNDRIDSNFGQNTLVAVTNFQRAIGTKSDGVVGSLTWSKMMNYGKEVIKTNGIPHDISYVNQNGFTIYNCELNESEYVKEEVKKDTIFLNSTSGCSRPDWTIGGWEKDHIKDKSGNPILDVNGNLQPIKVGVSYVIGRKSSNDDTTWDGIILNAFDDKYWAYNKDIDSIDFNSKSIGIEICNYGPLTMGRDGRFYNSVNEPINEKDVVKLDKPFRGYEYYEKYTDAQIESTRTLLVHLINKHSITIEGKIYNEKWFDYNSSWLKTGGIRTHSQVRRDEYGIFPQKELIQMLNSL
jgi:hypothetical protein